METEKMKIFESAKKNFASIYLEANKPPLHRMQLFYVSQNFLALILQFLYIVYDANTVIEYVNAILLSTIGVLVYISYWSAIFKTTVIYDFFIVIEKLADRRLKYPKAKAIYARASHLTEKICEFMRFIIIPAIIFILPKAVYCIFMYFTTDLGPDAFELPFPMWFPFDWKNPIGYLFAVFLQIRIALRLIRFIGFFISFGLGCFVCSLSLAKDLKGELKSINKNTSNRRTRAYIREQFIELIRLTNIKWLRGYFEEITRTIIILLFLGCMAAMLLGLLLIQIDLTEIGKEIDPLILFEATILCFGALILVFTVCEFGQRINNAFDEVYDDLLQLKFYLLPLEIQHLLIIVINYSQEPLIVRFFGSMSLTREQFKKVIRVVYQYFMVLREIYN